MSVRSRNRVLQAGPKPEYAQFAGILLHGRERSPEEMMGLAGQLDLSGVHWVAPAAEGGTWYPNRFMDPVSVNEPYLSKALARIHEMVNLASDQWRLKPEELAIVGFSQGACLAAEYAIRNPGRVRNIVVWTGALFGPAIGHWAKTSRNLEGTRVLITGSDVDEWVPEQYSYETARVFAELGAEVRLRMYQGRPHIVSPAEIAEARSFLGCKVARPSVAA